MKFLERIDGPRSGYGYQWRHYRAEVHKVRLDTGEIRAMKKAFYSVSCRDGNDYVSAKLECPAYAHAKREIVIMMMISYHPNILRCRKGMDRGEAIYFFFDYVECNLEKMLQPSNSPLSPPQRKEYLKQILTGIACVHSCGIVHRHLEPRFVLVDPAGTVKISEFGEAREVNRVDLNSRLVDHNFGYRAPEVIYGPRFCPASDVWAVGCIFAEMVLHKPLFTVSDSGDELFSIFSLFGRPDPDDTNDPFNFIEEFRSCVAKDLSLEPWGCFGIEETGLDLLKRMLTMELKDRITAEDALKHPYFTETTTDTKMIGIDGISGKRKFQQISSDASLECAQGISV